MASELAILSLFGFPAAGCVIAWIFTGRAWAAGRERHPSADLSRIQGMAIVLVVLPVTLLLFGFALYMLLAVFPDEPLPTAVVEASARAYGIPALLAALGEAIAIRRALQATFADVRLFGKGLVGVVLPETAVLFGFAVAFLILMGFRSLPPTATVEAFSISAGNAAWYVAIGALAAPAAGLLFSQSWSPENEATWKKAIVLAALPTYAFLGMFVLAFLELNA
ncbi:MAG TPA: hypothetical protein VJ400_05925 [Thermoplasmata archaeon]|nr:hypothetical protein [Thermoplasmata archaeon]